MSGLKARDGHSAGALVLSSSLTEVIIFGGMDRLNRHLAATTVLRFGEYTILLCSTYLTIKVNSLSYSGSWNQCLTLKH